LLTADIIDSGYKNITKDVTEANKVLGLGWRFDTLVMPDSIKFCEDFGNLTGRDVAASAAAAANGVNNTLVCRAYLGAEQIRTVVGAAREFRNSSDSLVTFSRLKRQNARDIVALRKKIGLLQLDSLECSLRLMNDGIRSIKGPDSISAADRARMSNDSLQLQNSYAILAIRQAEPALDSVIITNLSAMKKDSRQLLDSLLPIKFVVVDSIWADSVHIQKAPESVIIYGGRRYSLMEKISYVLGGICYRNLIGFLITALAVSLGAPFWFDLLNKLVSIRGAGIKPEEKKNAGTQTTQ
jgi:hypothetical protein